MRRVLFLLAVVLLVILTVSLVEGQSGISGLSGLSGLTGEGTVAATITPTSTSTPTATPTATATGGAPGPAYYFDATEGNDGGAGTLLDPYKTITKANSITTAGYTLCFQKGETWTGTKLTCASNITYTNYGTGELPFINGNGSVDKTIDLSSVNHVIINGLHAANSTAQDYVLWVANSTTSTITNCVISGGKYAALYGTGSITTNYDILVSNCIISGAAESGLMVMNSTSPGPTRWTITYNESYNNGTSTSSHHGFYIKYTSNSIIAHNTSHHNKASGIKVNSEGVAGALNNLIYNNYCYNNTGYGLYTGSHTNTWYNNLLSGNAANIQTDGDTSDSGFYYNTLINATSKAIRLYNTGTGNIWYNNIVVQDPAVVGTGHEIVYADSLANATAQTMDYNLYYYEGVTNLFNAGGSKTWTTWKAMSNAPDSHGVNADPLFAIEYTNLTLQAGSPAITAGIPITGITTDYLGLTRNVTHPSIGAYE